jgi:hypothetical protein
VSNRALFWLELLMALTWLILSFAFFYWLLPKVAVW